MVETVKPLRIPPMMSLYNDTHHVTRLIQSLVCSLLLEQPDDPISFLIKVLKKSSENIPSVLLLGPPSVGKQTVAMRLSSELKAVHVTTHNLLNQSEHSISDQQDEDFLVHCLQKRLKEPDCFNRGWVLDGFPQTRSQALTLQQTGVIPEHVVLLEAPDDVLLQRGRGRLLDPVSGDIYHHTFIRPEDDVIAGRLREGRSVTDEEHQSALQRYRREATCLQSAYQHSLKVVNADQPLEDVYHQVLSYVQTRRRSRTPRIILLGPPGSGKSLQAQLLSDKYKLVDVSGALVLELLEERLSRLDCSCRGWVLHGFPRDLHEARSLQQGSHRPNRVFFLEVTDEVCLERLSLRATDPVSGHRFHAVSCPPPTSEVQDRLKTRPEDSRECVSERVREFRVFTEALQCVFPDVVPVDADQDPRSVFEALESRLIED